MAKTLKELLKDVPEEQRADYLADPANKSAVEEAKKAEVKTTDPYKDALGNDLVLPAGSDQWIPEEQYEDYSSDPANLGGTKGTDTIKKYPKAEITEAVAENESDETRYTDRYNDLYTDAYTESPAVAAARAALDKLTAPSPYSSAWQDKLSAAVDRILNRKAFSYDYTSDPVYAAYGAKYKKLGKAAAEDVIGKTAAYTGGYANSYSSTAANAAYLSYVSKLSDKLPELYEAALKRYDNETASMYDEYEMLRSLENDGYSRYRSTVSDHAAERDRLAKLLANEQNAEYKKYTAAADAKYKADSLVQKKERSEAELAFKAEQAQADRELALAKLEKELAYKAETDGRKNAGSEKETTVGAPSELPAGAGDAGTDAADEKGTENGITLNGIKNDFYGLLTGQGIERAFTYIDGLISEGRISIQAARSVLSECGVLDEYLAKKRRTGGSGASGSSSGAAFAVNSLM